MKDTHYEMAYWADSWDELPTSLFDTDIPNDILQGQANLIDNKVILDIPLEPASVTITEPQFCKNYWYGFTRNKKYLAVRNMKENSHECQQFLGHTKRTLQAEYLLAASQPFNPEGDITKMQIHLTGLNHWIDSFEIKEPLESETSQQITYTCDIDNAEYQLFSDDRYKIKVKEFLIKESTADGADFVHDAELIVALHSGKNLNDAVSLACRLAEFFSLCAGFYVTVEELDLKFAEASELVHCYRTFAQGSKTNKKLLKSIPFKYETLKEKWPSLFKQWLRPSKDPNIDDFMNAGQITASLMSSAWVIPMDLRFLAAAQVLEMLVREDREAVKLGTLKEQVEVLLSNHSACEKWLALDAKRFARRHASERNYYTHRDRASLEPLTLDDLFYHTEAVHLACYVILWAMIGLDEQDVVETLERAEYKTLIRAYIKELIQKSDYCDL